MKNKLLILSLLIIFGLQASAVIDTSKTSEREYLLNHGYSKATVDMVYSSKAAVNNEVYVTDAERDAAKYKYVWPVNWLRKLYIYLDPAMESDFMHHDVKMTPSANDL